MRTIFAQILFWSFTTLLVSLAACIAMPHVWGFTPYCLLILASVGSLSYVLVVRIALPLQTLARRMEQFGHGDLKARMKLSRQDEIGVVSRCFDQMGDRIETLLQAERRLFQDVSHELRSPLARLRFAAELARTSNDRAAAIERITREVDRLTTLVDSLLDVTRVESDPAARHPEVFSVAELLEDLVESCWIETDVRHCRVRLDAYEAIPVRADRELIHRAVENVVRNAIRYAPPDSSIDIKVEPRRPLVRITVRDYGPGVPETHLNDIFRPFFRVESARDSATRGMGLGLAIAHRAVTLHSGRVWAENRSPGLLVSIELPSALNGCEP